MIICSYCYKETFDEEFCDSCGKFLNENEISKVTSNENTTEDLTNYVRETLDCIIINSNLKTTYLKQINSDRIQSPVLVKEDKLYFIDDEEITLEEYLDNNEISTNEIYELTYRFLEIFKAIEENELILGSINMSDFWIKNNDLSTLFYRQTNRFLNKNDNLNEYIIKSIYSPEVMNRNTEYINEKTDIYLIGKIFINLITKNKIYIQNYKHERFIGYNLELFNNKIPREFHSWIDKTTSIFQKDRYQSVSDCLENFLKIINTYNQRVEDNKHKVLTLDSDCITNVGKTKAKGKDLDLYELIKNITPTSINDIDKLQKAIEEYKKSNEDSHLLLKTDNKMFAMVADGVSNCTFGSGYHASNIVLDVCTELWNNFNEEINDKDTIKVFLNKVIELSNKKILQHVSKLVEDTSVLKDGIMATTFSSVIIIDDIAYYMNLGDSPIYLLNEDNISLLSVEDNQGNKKIKNGLSWNDYLNLEDKSHLVKYIGGDFALEYLKEDEVQPSIIDFEIKKLKLLKDDMLIICSDGLTDYINSISNKDDIWSNDNKLKEMILEEDISLCEINKKLVKQANNNGGGDNITVILIKVDNVEECI